MLKATGTTQEDKTQAEPEGTYGGTTDTLNSRSTSALVLASRMVNSLCRRKEGERSGCCPMLDKVPRMKSHGMTFVCEA